MKVKTILGAFGFLGVSVSAQASPALPAVEFPQKVWSAVDPTIREIGYRVGFGQIVNASWYGGGERLSSRTASGERFNPNGLTLAHRSLPLGSLLRVSLNGRSAVCRVNDRGPSAKTGRSVDLARGCARAIGFHGVGHVQIARIR